MKTPVCPECDSANIEYSASAVWDPNLQKRVLHVTHEDFTCCGCGFRGVVPKWTNLMRAVLTITVEYDVSEAKDLKDPQREIEDLLMAASNHLASNGLLSGETEMTVEQWDADVTVTP